MIAITVKWDVKPEHAEEFPSLTQEFTQACRAEPGCLWFEWSRSLDRPTEYVLVEAFADGDAATHHVQSEHFRTAMATFGRYVTSRPKIVSVEKEGAGWDELGELEMPGDRPLTRGGPAAP